MKDKILKMIEKITIYFLSLEEGGIVLQTSRSVSQFATLQSKGDGHRGSIITRNNHVKF